MAIYVDQATRQRISYMKHSGDFYYDQSGDEAVVQEDVPVIGAWEDWTGSGGTTSANQQHFASRENSLQGSDEQITDNAKLPNLSVVGTRVGTNRRRTKKIYINPSELK